MLYGTLGLVVYDVEKLGSGFFVPGPIWLVASSSGRCGATRLSL